jgi:hypothetical protein
VRVNRPETLMTPVPQEPQGVLAAQAKTAHFWIYVLSTAAGIVLHSNVFGAAAWMTLSSELLPLVQYAAYQIAALWQPPRVQWNDEQRFSYYAAQLRAAGYTVERYPGERL